MAALYAEWDECVLPKSEPEFAFGSKQATNAKQADRVDAK